MNIEEEIAAIKERNMRVERDKRWETSFVRRAVIIVVTYIAAFALLSYIGAPQAYTGAFVPCLGYLLSTLSLTIVRRIWEK
jgi:hypothetical protein